MIKNENIENAIKYQEANNYQKDLLLYVDMLKATHPYYADKKHQEQLEKQIHKMYKECGRITNDLDFKVYIAKIASQLNDGHTVVPYWMTFKKIFPIRFMIDGDSPVAIIEVSSEDRKDLLGKAVKRINGKSIKRILKMARPLVSADNDANYENTIKEFLMFADFWSLLGMNNEVMHLTLADGSNVAIHAMDKQELKIAHLQKSKKESVTAQRNVLFDYTIFDEEGICYLQFNQFADRITHPNHQQLARFDRFVSDMMVEMKVRGIPTLVVDLQYNGGGNSQLGDVLLSWLYPYQATKRYGVEVRISDLLYAHYPRYREFTVNGAPLNLGKLYDYWDFDHSNDYQIDYSAPQDSAKHVFNFDSERIFQGNVIFIQSKNSFSSATLLLTLARDNGIGTIIGEPSGGKPSHYGDVLYCSLPHTGTIATVSHKHFLRPNKALNEDSILPDVLIELGNSNKDLLWEWIISNYSQRVK